MTPSLKLSTKGLPAAFLLSLLAFFPILGVVALSISELAEASEARASIREIETAVDDAILTSELRASLFDERNWSVAVLGMAELGIPIALAESFIVLDHGLLEVLDVAKAETDRLLIAIESAGVLSPELTSELHAEVATLRASDMSSGDLLFQYEHLQYLANAGSKETFERVEMLAGNLENGAALLDATKVVLAADQARVLIAEEQSGYLRTQVYLGEEPIMSHRDLIDYVTGYEDAMQVLQSLPGKDSAAADAVRELKSDPDVADFERVINSVITQALLGGVRPQSSTLTQLLDSTQELTDTLSAAVTSADVHATLLYAAQTDLHTETDFLLSGIQQRTRRATAIGAVFLVVSLGAVLGGIRSIVRPLNRLADAATDLSSGTDRNVLFEGGPVEVRAAADAIHEAGLNLRLAERQAQSLSRGSVEDESLATQVPGELGSSLQEAVRTLTLSIRQSQEYRTQLAFEANHDGLTQIANRTASLANLAEALQAAEQTGDQVAVLFIDLDRFKQVNDRFGHRAGDHVLRTVAHRLQAEIRDTDHAGRLGGDEFVVIANPIKDVAEVVNLAERLIERVCAPMEWEESVVSVGASIGIGLSSAYSDPLSDHLMSDADLAVYQAKGLGSGRVEVCSDDLRERVSRKAVHAAALRSALDHHEFVVHYQAVVSPDRGKVMSLEALVRWDRPGHGILAAESFIDFAERSALIVEIDRRVLDLVLAQLDAWSADPVLGGLPVSVNVSGRNLASEDFVESVLNRLDKSRVDPGRLILEVKENSLFENIDEHAAKLQRLREEGLHVAVDNFGTGYTSLARLRYLPIDILKIDSSFVAHVVGSPDDRALVQMIVDTGHLLGATILAEGVETPEQADQMRRLGSDELQGYLFAQPQPATDLGAAIVDLDPTLLGLSES